MDPNDLYNLAAQAGLTGEPQDYSQMGAGTPSYADYVNNSAPPDSYKAGGFTDEDIMASFVPQAAQDSPAAPPPSAPLQPGERAKAGMSVSNSGYSDKKNQQIAKGPGGRLDNQIASIKAEGGETEAERDARVAKAAKGEQEAAHGEMIATTQNITAMGHQKAILAGLEQAHDAKTEAMVQQGMNEANETKAKYVAAMNDFRAARVNPAQLWGDMSGGQQFGMLVSAFAHDFLAAKGIKSSSMDTLNKAIDRSIDAQVQAINSKGKVAEGFKSLWEMQTADSHSMLEARTRMKGFMLDSFKTATEAYMSQFDAQLATAKGRVGIAKIDSELAKTMNEIGQHVDTNTTQKIQQAVTRYGDELRASAEAAKISVDKERNRIEAAKSGLNEDKNLAELVYDNSKSGQGYANGVFKPGIDKEEKIAYRKEQASTNHLTDLISEYRELDGKYGPQGALAGTRLAKEDDARLRAAAAEVLEARALKYSGKAVTNEERKILETGSPQRVFAMTRQIASQLADTERRERQALNRKRETLVFDLPDDSTYRRYRSGMGGEAKTEIKEAGMVGDGSDKATSPEQDAVSIANKQLEKHNAFKPVEGTIFEDLQADHDRFVESHPDEYASKTSTKHFGKDDYQVTERDTKVKGFEKGLSDLAKVASLAEKSGDMDTYQNAVGRLKAAMDPTLNGDNNLMSDYAAMKLADLNESVSTSSGSASEPKQDTAPDELDPRAKLPPIPNKKKK